jgi:peroxiredoxin Q/BCP
MDTGIVAEGNRVTQQSVELKAGDGAPDFEAQDGDGRTWRLSELRGQRVVLYFYPADDTPGCTAEACDFRDTRRDFANAGYLVLGVSPQNARSHKAFSEKYGLNFPLLIDHDLAIARRYGAVRTKDGGRGDAPFRIRRSTFVIDEGGNVSQALYGVEGRGHVAGLRELLSV